MTRIIVLMAALMCWFSTSAHAITLFSDDFNDGNTAGWSFYGPNSANWTVSGGILHHDGGYNGNPSYALVNGVTTPSHFALEADVTVISNRYGLPDWGHVGLIWGVDTTTNDFNTSYLRTHWDHVTSWSKPYLSYAASERFLGTPGATNGNTYHLSVEVDYLAQSMTVMMDGFSTVFSGADFNVLNQHSGGGIGLISWSDHVTYDNVVLNDLTNPVPEPGTLLLLGSGLVGLVAFRKRSAR